VGVSLVCQVCGRRSGIFPLCSSHYDDFLNGKLELCKGCDMWVSTSESCQRCSSNADTNSIVFIHRDELEYWGKKLYAIGQDGVKYKKTKFDGDRYSKVLDISREMKEFWEGKPNQSPVSMDQVKSWSKDLTTIADKGLEHSDDSYDIRRYNDILNVAKELNEESVSYFHSLRTRELESSESVKFVADREILPALIGLIESAEKKILVSSPWIRGINDIVEKLCEAQEQRNVHIKALVRKEEGKGWDDDVRSLARRGIHVEAANFLHSKMLLIDDKALYIGSANLVQTSMDRNLEAGIITYSNGAVEKAAMYFQTHFLDAFDKRGE